MFGVCALIIVILHFFILSKTNVWDDDVVFITSLFMPFLFVSMLAVGTGYYQLHSEWRTNSIYLLLSLPIRGWAVLVAKLSAVLTALMLTLAVTGISFAIILLHAIWPEFKESAEIFESFPLFLNLTANSFWIYTLLVCFVLVLIQFAYLCGQLVHRFKWLVVTGAFLAALRLVLRVSPLLSQLLLWLPDVYFGGENYDVLYLHSGPFLVLLLFTIVLTWLNGYIFQKVVEV